MERIQKDINASMRAVLIDWLVEVSYDIVRLICIIQENFPHFLPDFAVSYLF